ncbi:ChbG/HpnK family deacetylase [Pseudonocardia sp. TRM90224]|uniref:ChbG/HpnK family deacetylase n=1 Tax=Pseudonocardia sp. TRM90224 TaxID=2812678 RepID=UPI001E4E9EBF|nr:ChbG/HpnK family deacetylase [Pseudonocardia sp. TRM90224]
MTRRLLIVNADDYGLTPAISRGILACHDAGIVTSVSVLATGPAVATTAPWLADRPGLEVGAHLAAVGEDPPLLTAREIPTLVDRRGSFRMSWRSFVLAVAAGRVDPDDITREFGAQLDRLIGDLGLRPRHLDTHQHLHLCPPVARVVTELALRRGIRAVRVPTSAARGPRAIGVRRWSRALAARLTAAGLVFPAAFGGLDEAGRLDHDVLQALIARLAAGPAASIEVNCHPGTPTAADRAYYAWNYGWETEVAGLTDPRLRHAVDRLGLQLGGYAELTGLVP